MSALSTRGFCRWVARWAARITAAPLAALVALIAVGEGLPNPLRLTVAGGAQLAALAIVRLGLLVGFRWEAVGGAAILSGSLAFYAINFAAAGRIPGGLFPWFALPGVLYLISATISWGLARARLA